MQLGCVWTASLLVTVALNGSMACFDALSDCSSLSAPSKIIFGHSRPIKSVGYSSTSDRLITASYDCTMLIWDVDKGLAEAFSGAEGHSGSIQSITVCGDKVASVGVDDRLVIASVSSRLFEQSVNLTSQPRAVVSSDNQMVLVICYKGVYLFSLASGTAPLQLNYLDVPGEPTTGAISDSANIIAVGKSDGNILIYSINDEKSLQLLSNVPEKTNGEPTAMSFSPDGTYLAVGDAERYLYLYKVNREIGGDGTGTTLIRLREWRSHTARVTCVAWTPNSEMLASGSLDCGLNVYRPEMSTKICEVRAAHPASMITSLVWKSNNVLFSTGQDAFIKSWVFQ